MGPLQKRGAKIANSRIGATKNIPFFHLCFFSSGWHAHFLYPGCLSQSGEEAEITPVEPDPARTGARKSYTSTPCVNYLGVLKMNLNVNGEIHDHHGDGSIPALLAELGATPEHSALTVNGDLIVSSDWPSVQLTETDRIDVLTFVGGG
jgi:thiamine biosynthesis protein ThiS